MAPKKPVSSSPGAAARVETEQPLADPSAGDERHLDPFGDPVATYRDPHDTSPVDEHRRGVDERRVDERRDDERRDDERRQDPSPVDERRQDRHAVGDLVTYRYWDPYIGAGGAEAIQIGFVVAIVTAPDDETPPGYRVAWLPAATDPLSGDSLEPISTEPTTP